MLRVAYRRSTINAGRASTANEALGTCVYFSPVAWRVIADIVSMQIGIPPVIVYMTAYDCVMTVVCNLS
jgi:hypothetical protein